MSVQKRMKLKLGHKPLSMFCIWTLLLLVNVEKDEDRSIANVESTIGRRLLVTVPDGPWCLEDEKQKDIQIL